MRMFYLFLVSTLIVFSGQAYSDLSRPLASVTIQESLANPGLTGPYQVSSYTRGLGSRAYQSAIIYYPTSKDGPMAATTLSGGYGNSKEQISWLAQHQASHGIITIVFTPNIRYTSNPLVWSQGHIGSYETLITESLRPQSPIFSKIDPERIGIMGYSMGGAGTILAANELDGLIKSAIPIFAYQPQIPLGTFPILFLTSNSDSVAPASSIHRSYQMTNGSSTKAYAMFNGLSHLAPMNNGRNQDRLARYITAWNQVYLNNDQRYLTYLNGLELENDLMDSQIFASPSDYEFLSSE